MPEENGAQVGLIGLAVMGENLALNIARQRVPGRRLQPHRRTRRTSSGRARPGEPRSRPTCSTGVRRRARTAAAGHADGQGRRAGRRRDRRAAALPRAGRHRHRRRQLATSPTPSAARVSWPSQGHQLRRDGRLRRRGGRAQGPELMPGGPPEAYASIEPMLVAHRRQDRGRALRDLHRSRRRRPLRQDGPQRHRVRRHAAHRRGLRLMQPGAGHVGAGDRRGLRGVERGRARLVPDRDHRRGASAVLDPETGKPLVDVILDQAGQKGTGAGPARTRSSSACRSRRSRPRSWARNISAFKEQRVGGAGGPAGADVRRNAQRDRAAIVDRRGRRRSTPRRSPRTPRAWRCCAPPRIERGTSSNLAEIAPHLEGRLHHPRAAARTRSGGLRRKTPSCRTCCSTRSSPTEINRAAGRLAPGDRARRSTSASPARRWPPRWPTIDSYRSERAAGQPDPGASATTSAPTPTSGRQAGHFHTEWLAK